MDTAHGWNLETYLIAKRDERLFENSLSFLPPEIFMRTQRREWKNFVKVIEVTRKNWYM